MKSRKVLLAILLGGVILSLPMTGIMTGLPVNQNKITKL